MAIRRASTARTGRKGREPEVKIKHLIRILRKEIQHVNAVLFALRRLDPNMVIPLSARDRANIRAPKQAAACGIIREEISSSGRSVKG